jgi:hypothetical protein
VTQILCCYTQPKFNPATRAGIAEHAPATQLIDVTEDPFGYWREIRSRWEGTEDLILIEHDNEVPAGAIESLTTCPEPWCCYAYPIFRTQHRLRLGLGLTKFSAKAQQAVTPRRIAEGFSLCTTCKGQGCWNHLDGRITELLKQDAGLKPHVHGDVQHYHDYGEWEGPVAGKPIETYDEDWGDVEPAVLLPNRIPRRDFYAQTPRQAIAIAESLSRLQEDSAEFRMPATNFSTDKAAHGYLPVYIRLAKILGPAARICEVGVWKGGSLDLWRELFPQATIMGIDNDPEAVWPTGTIAVLRSQDDAELPGILDAYEEEWDLIVDDASHDGVLTQRTFDLLWPLVSAGGYYVIEDWFVGFANFPDYGTSMLTLAKNMVDRLSPFTPDGAYTDVASIEYQHGLIIVRKVV